MLFVFSCEMFMAKFILCIYGIYYVLINVRTFRFCHHRHHHHVMSGSFGEVGIWVDLQQGSVAPSVAQSPSLPPTAQPERSTEPLNATCQLPLLPLWRYAWKFYMLALPVENPYPFVILEIEIPTFLLAFYRPLLIPSHPRYIESSYILWSPRFQ